MIVTVMCSRSCRCAEEMITMMTTIIISSSSIVELKWPLQNIYKYLFVNNQLFLAYLSCW